MSDDRNKGRGGRKKSRGAQRSDKSGSAKYKRELDKLFSSGETPERFKDLMKGIEPEEGTPEAERKEAIQALRDAEGFREFARAVNEYREAGWEFPDDENLLIKMLDHPDERVVRAALEHYLDLGGRRELERIPPLKNRLSTIRTMSDDPRTRKLVDDVEAMIG